MDSPVRSTAAALDHLGYVQIDPINVCGRMHDLILRNRVEGYRPGDLLEHIHQDARPGFEHYLPEAGILCAFPLDAWRYVAPAMLARREMAGRYSGKLSPHEEEIARRVLDELGSRGPLMSDEVEHKGRALTAWGTDAREVKTVLEKLFFHGRVLITCRRSFRRVYDLPERVLPKTDLFENLPDAEETRRWLILLRLRQRRLVRLTKRDVSIVEDCIQPVKVDGRLTLYILNEDAGLLSSAVEVPQTAAEAPLLLAPLDPLVYDRRVTRDLWNFDYIWEVYTPAAKRTRGYYALPVLQGTKIVGHVDLKADRKAQRLRVVNRKIRKGFSSASGVAQLAKFLALKT
ncbi:MAG TPA: crosslink repair DNA glycosylase YcaQ family protein [Chthoniobacteraceae bacterium]|jgi:hypothetical protein